MFRDRRVIFTFNIYLYLFYNFHTKGQAKHKIITGWEIVVWEGKLLDGLLLRRYSSSAEVIKFELT